MEVGLKIKGYLDERGISQVFLSRQTGIDHVKLNLALNGNRRFTFNEYCLICGALGLDTNFFLRPRLPEKPELVDRKEVG